MPTRLVSGFQQKEFFEKHHSKYQKLSTPQIEFHFVVVANFGYHYLIRELKTLNLDFIEIHPKNEIKHRIFLTPDGLKALKDDSLLHSVAGGNTVISDIDKFIAPEMFSLNMLWESEDMRIKTMQFCKEVGTQLLQIHTEEKNWPEEKIEECALGMKSQALSIAFSHSIPKGILPLFWVGGNVEYNGRHICWEPLFPNVT